MKKALIIAAALGLGVVASQAQGLVSISLTGGNLVTTNSGTASGVIFGSGTAGYYFELLFSSTLTATSAGNIMNTNNLAQWTDSGVSGASFPTALNKGKINALGSTTANGWTAPGASYDNERAVDLVAWSGVYGTTYGAFLNSLASVAGGGLAAGGYFGFETGLNYAGGGTSSLNAVDQFGNQTGLSGAGLNSPLVLNLVTGVPEPTTMALAGLGGLSLLALRRKK